MVMCAPIIEQNFLEYNVNHEEMDGFIYNDDMPPLVSDDDMPELVSGDDIPPLFSDDIPPLFSDDMPELVSDECIYDVIYGTETYEMLERENPALGEEISRLQDLFEPIPFTHGNIIEKLYNYVNETTDDIKY